MGAQPLMVAGGDEPEPLAIVIPNRVAEWRRVVVPAVTAEDLSLRLEIGRVALANHAALVAEGERCRSDIYTPMAALPALLRGP